MSMQSIVKAKPRLSLSSAGVVGATMGFLAYSIVGNAPRPATEAELRAVAIAMVPSNARECVVSARAKGDTMEHARNECAVTFPAPASAPPVTEFASCMLRGDEILRETGSSSPHETFRLNLKACHEAFPQAPHDTILTTHIAGGGTGLDAVKDKEKTTLAEWAQREAVAIGLSNLASKDSAAAKDTSIFEILGLQNAQSQQQQALLISNILSQLQATTTALEGMSPGIFAEQRLNSSTVNGSTDDKASHEWSRKALSHVFSVQFSTNAFLKEMRTVVPDALIAETFTVQGYESFLNAIGKSEWAKSAIAKHDVVRTGYIGEFQFISEQVNAASRNVMRSYEVPITMTFTNSGTLYTRNVKVTMKVLQTQRDSAKPKFLIADFKVADMMDGKPSVGDLPSNGAVNRSPSSEKAFQDTLDSMMHLSPDRIQKMFPPESRDRRIMGSTDMRLQDSVTVP